MEIYLDNEPYAPAEAAPATINDLIDQLKPKLSAENRLIVSISCDQQLIEEAQIDQVMKHSLSNYQRLDFATESVSVLALGAMEAASTLLAESRAKQNEIIELLSQDKNSKAIEILSHCVTDWCQAHDTMVKTLHLLGLNIDELKYEDTSLISILEQVAHQLNQLKECLTAGDYVLLNDLLQYEITPCFDQWEGVVRSIKDRIQEQVSS